MDIEAERAESLAEAFAERYAETVRLAKEWLEWKIGLYSLRKAIADNAATIIDYYESFRHSLANGDLESAEWYWHEIVKLIATIAAYIDLYDIAYWGDAR